MMMQYINYQVLFHLDDNEKADYELNKLVNNYPDSEYVKKAKLILNN